MKTTCLGSTPWLRDVKRPTPTSNSGKIHDAKNEDRLACIFMGLRVTLSDAVPDSKPCERPTVDAAGSRSTTASKVGVRSAEFLLVFSGGGPRACRMTHG
ncbi:MAG TPA: hypothetical protein VHI52_15065, partial [Verrucomicrobiae bacterium]|nr:hypothetical protein [Verrucomicrobiae bacterium]